jgi:hypothetical protein
MRFSPTARIAGLAVCLFGLLDAPAIRAEESNLTPTDSAGEITLSPHAYHFHSDPTHKPVWLIGLERQRSDGWLWGGAYFSNSFGQKSGAVYVGYLWINLFNAPTLYATLVGGLMYGYVAPYEDKVPFNQRVFADPRAVPWLPIDAQRRPAGLADGQRRRAALLQSPLLIAEVHSATPMRDAGDTTAVADCLRPHAHRHGRHARCWD